MTFLGSCATKPPTELRPNHVLIQSNDPTVIPIARSHIRKRGYVSVDQKAIAQSVLVIRVENWPRPYASTRFDAVDYEHKIPVSMTLTDRQGVQTWKSQATGEAHTAPEALRLAVRDCIEGYQKRNAGLMEIFKTPIESILRIERPIELPRFKP